MFTPRLCDYRRAARDYGSKMEDVPVTKYNYPTYLRAGGNFPRDQCLVRTGVRRDEW
jgi:hypothetical protein